MTRRSLFAFFTAFAILIAAPFAAQAGGSVDYKPGLIKKALAEGKTVFVDYAAHWCGTCAAQERVVSRLRKQNAAYDRAMLFVRVDWDTYSSHMVTSSRNIPRRSTLLVLRGDKELGRVVAGTSTSVIKSLMDKGLAAGG